MWNIGKEIDLLTNDLDKPSTKTEVKRDINAISGEV